MKKFLCIIIAMLGIWAILAFFYVQIPDYYQDRTGKRGEIWQNVLSKVICKVGNGSNFYF
ncbi:MULTISPECIES: hypothetical protein [Bacteroidales]|jgi:hypothetical protein|uniref:Uncharacterized protein n=1 Tax=Coprobacter secundus subsp. similis TaxID=2751153 RepID=A0A7G1HYL7_9BACT|nr:MULTISPECIES: hypothetical protein [Bacteroidales]KHM45015.1 hypothetical protein PU94_13145 [Coprobacter secundus]BCI63534.1 hypothetical protein Cop2CBH44_18870 [Coprobacter secundus subsp. similis]CCY35080.1 unknown [Tannerella sp. CAG:118]